MNKKKIGMWMREEGVEISKKIRQIFKLGSFTTSEKMNQVLVLTMIDLHVISFHKFLHSFLTEQAISGGGVRPSLLDAKATLRQIQLSLMVILEVSKANNVSSVNKTFLSPPCFCCSILSNKYIVVGEILTPRSRSARECERAGDGGLV